MHESRALGGALLQGSGAVPSGLASAHQGQDRGLRSLQELVALRLPRAALPS